MQRSQANRAVIAQRAKSRPIVRGTSLPLTSPTTVLPTGQGIRKGSVHYAGSGVKGYNSEWSLAVYARNGRRAGDR